MILKNGHFLFLFALKNVMKKKTILQWFLNIDQIWPKQGPTKTISFHILQTQVIKRKFAATPLLTQNLCFLLVF